MHFITKYIRKNLMQNYDAERVAGAQRFFKEGIKLYGAGTKAEVVKLVGAAISAYAKPLDFASALVIAEELFSSQMYEECQSAIIILEKYKKYFTPNNLKLFEKWIDRYVDNWGVCDSFCLGVLAPLLSKHPFLMPKLLKWSNSENRWKRRAACSTLVKLCRHGAYTAEAFKLVKSLLSDKDEMVQKGAGWLLKEVSRKEAQKVIDFLNQNRRKIPSLVKSYAMERMNGRQRVRVLKRKT